MNKQNCSVIKHYPTDR